MTAEQDIDLKSQFPNFFRNFDPSVIPDGWKKVFTKLVGEVNENLDSFERMETEWHQPTRLHPLGMPSKLNIIIFDLVEDAENSVMGMCETCGKRDVNMVVHGGHAFCQEHANAGH